MTSILIVDDEPDVRSAFERFLKLSGFDVTACSCARDAELAALEGTFEVMIVDLNLPDGTGLELAERLRARHCSAKLIVLTGDPSPETQRLSRELEIARYLKKPVRASVLIDVVKEVLAEKQGTS